MADAGWRRPFDDPIPLPSGRQLVTLKDAGNYITKLPKAEHDRQTIPKSIYRLVGIGAASAPTSEYD
jgi:hypothetical protein